MTGLIRRSAAGCSDRPGPHREKLSGKKRTRNKLLSFQALVVTCCLAEEGHAIDFSPFSLYALVMLFLQFFFFLPRLHPLYFWRE